MDHITAIRWLVYGFMIWTVVAVFAWAISEEMEKAGRHLNRVVMPTIFLAPIAYILVLPLVDHLFY